LCISAPFIIAAQHNNNIEKKDSYVLTDIIKMMYLWDVLILLPPNIVPSIGHYDASVFFCWRFILSDEIEENRIDLFLLTADSDSNKLSGAYLVLNIF
jgi:hypothetical protein